MMKRLSLFVAGMAFFFSSSAQHGLKLHATSYLDHLYNESILFDTSHVEETGPAWVAVDSLNGWKEWRTVDNYFFGKNRGSLPMITDLEALHPYFRDKVEELILICKRSGIELQVVETYRTPAKQAEYFGMGKKYTRSPGGRSRHQYGLAVDLVPVVDSVPVWNNARLWRKIGLAGERLGLRWGGRWRVPYDPAHFEWSGGISSYQLTKGYFPDIPRTKQENYPCIEEDIQLLKKYWDAWGVEQAVMAKNPGPLAAQ